MKKALLLCLALLMLAGAALADVPDVSALPDDELQSLAAACDAEIARRLGGAVEVPVGVYIVGEDIPAGSWRLTSSGAIIGIYADQAAYAADNPAFYEFLAAGETVGKITLAAGSIVSLTGAVTFEPYAGLGFGR